MNYKTLLILIILTIVLLTLMCEHGNWKYNKTETQKTLKKNYDEFCVKDRLLPSIFVIGVQKCGTTTLNRILNRFS